MFKKKIALVLLSFMLLFSTFPSLISAQENKDEPTSPYVQSYSYNYNGIEFSGDSPLTPEQIKTLYDGIMNLSHLENESDINMIPDGGNNGRIIYGPVRRSFDNSVTRAFIDATISFLATKIKKLIVTQNFWAKWAFTTITGWVSGNIAPDTYVEYWVWELLRPGGCYSEYHTYVHHEDIRFNNPISVQYMEVGFYCN